MTLNENFSDSPGGGVFTSIVVWPSVSENFYKVNEGGCCLSQEAWYSFSNIFR